MSEKDYFIDKDMNGSRLANVADPVNDQDASTKKYVDDEISANSAGGAGVILEYREFVNSTTNTSYNENETVVELTDLPQGYFMCQLSCRAIGSDIVANNANVTRVAVRQTGSTQELTANEDILVSHLAGASNSGRLYVTFFFRKVAPGSLSHDIVFKLDDPAKTIIMAGAKARVYRLADPATSWS